MNEETKDPINEEQETSTTKETPKVPSLLHNYISFAGMAIVVISLASIVLLFSLEMTSPTSQPYLGILTYIMLPTVMVFGLIIILLGVLWERRRRRKLTPEQIAAYPILDLNGPRRRRAFLTFLSLSFIFLLISAFGSYRAFEYTESVEFCGQLCHTVMKPEFVAHEAAPHSQIRCVECHVGSGPENYARAKFNGIRQLYAVTFNTYNKPIETPVHNMRPANETCQKCHWSEKYHGEKFKVFNHYGYDKDNSLTQTRLLIKVGGGNASNGQTGGIHWHMNLNNEVLFISSDPKRQNVQWVKMTKGDGSSVEYFAKDANLSPDQIEAAPKRRMDCIDCHNRPTHIYLSPNQAVDRSIDADKLDTSLPFLKLKAVEVLSGNYATTEEALNAIATKFPDYYKVSYPDIYATKKMAIDAATTELQHLYQTYFFPEMKTDWQSSANNIGHLTAQGCFRCHDGQMSSKDGKIIRNECNICHTAADQTIKGKTFTPQDGKFQHPVNLGDRGNFKCAACHSGNRAFQHPVNLGDISKFQCVECHKGLSFKPVK